MADPFVAVVVTVPEEYFTDEDDICLAAGNSVCGRLELHLVEHGHTIPDWIQGGCDEDWGVYFQSLLGETTFEYHICFSPGPQDAVQNQMLVRYHVRPPFLKRLFRKPEDPPPDHPMHEVMRSFGALFSTSRMLTRQQFDREFGHV